MLKAVTRQASAVDSKISLLNAPASAASPSFHASHASRPTPFEIATHQTSRSLEKAREDTNRPDVITPAYFFDHYAQTEDIAVQVTEEDFMEAQRELVPSVSGKELEHYGRVRAMFESVGEREAREKVVAENEEREVENGQGDRKGKGKEVVRNGNGTGTGSVQVPLRHKVNGMARRPSGEKGKGKARAVDVDSGEDEGYEAGGNGFGMGDVADDEGLY